MDPKIIEYLLSILYLAASIGAVIEVLKSIIKYISIKYIKYDFTLTKFFKEFALPVTPYLIATALYVILKVSNPIPIVNLILAASLSDTAYRIIKKSLEAYSNKQEKVE